MQKIGNEENIDFLQQGQNNEYTWVRESLMEFNENKFWEISHGNSDHIKEGI